LKRNRGVIFGVSDSIPNVPQTPVFGLVYFEATAKIVPILGIPHTVLYGKKLPFRTVLMDTWYASMQVIKYVEKLKKLYLETAKRGYGVLRKQIENRCRVVIAQNPLHQILVPPDF
jgi:hypothetical protein